jgi:hypothetical protein
MGKDALTSAPGAAVLTVSEAGIADMKNGLKSQLRVSLEFMLNHILYKT